MPPTPLDVNPVHDLSYKIVTRKKITIIIIISLVTTQEKGSQEGDTYIYNKELTQQAESKSDETNFVKEFLN